MLKYMGEQFVGGAFHSPLIGHFMGLAVSRGVWFPSSFRRQHRHCGPGAISFLMSRDEELPPRFQRLNSFGVPNLGLVVAAVIPALLVLAIKDVGGLADLYAVGVVGAIATNLGRQFHRPETGAGDLGAHPDVLHLPDHAGHRTLVVCREGPRAQFCPGGAGHWVHLAGIGRRKYAAQESGGASRRRQPAGQRGPVHPRPLATLPIQLHEASGPPMMCAVRGLGKTLDFAIEEARQTDRPLYLLFIRTVPVLTEEDYKRKWQDDPEAREIFLEARKKAGAHPVFPCYAVSDSVAHTIVDITATMGASYLVFWARRNGAAWPTCCGATSSAKSPTTCRTTFTCWCTPDARRSPPYR